MVGEMALPLANGPLFSVAEGDWTCDIFDST